MNELNIECWLHEGHILNWFDHNQHQHRHCNVTKKSRVKLSTLSNCWVPMGMSFGDAAQWIWMLCFVACSKWTTWRNHVEALFKCCGWITAFVWAGRSWILLKWECCTFFKSYLRCVKNFVVKRHIVKFEWLLREMESVLHTLRWGLRVALHT